MKDRWLPSPEHFPKKNALTPIGATAFGIFGASLIACLYLGDSPMGWTVLALGSLPMLATVWGFIHFARQDPDRLQTEDYRIQREVVARMSIDRAEGDPHFPPIDAKPVLPSEAGEENNDV